MAKASVVQINVNGKSGWIDSVFVAAVVPSPTGKAIIRMTDGKQYQTTEDCAAITKKLGWT